MWEKIVETLSHWLEATSPARKVADVAVAFIIALLAGSLFVAYKAEGEIRRLAIKALDKTPELDNETAGKLIEPLLKDCQRAGGIAVAVFSVDLAGNTTKLTGYAGPAELKERFPRLKLGLDKAPFIYSGMADSQVVIASSMMEGNSTVVYHPESDITIVSVPIPEKHHAFLAGFVMCGIKGKVSEDSAEVVNVKLLLSDFSQRVL